MLTRASQTGRVTARPLLANVAGVAAGELYLLSEGKTGIARSCRHVRYDPKRTFSPQ